MKAEIFSILESDQQLAAEQEYRQLLLKVPSQKITVHVSREDFPSIQGTIDFEYYSTSAQAAWPVFLNKVRIALNIDFIDSVYDKFDKSPVHCTSRLRDGGYYIVRQREESSILEMIQTGKKPGVIVWPVTQFINAAKESLVDLNGHSGGMNHRVDRLIQLPTIREYQREVALKIVAAKHPDELLEIILQAKSQIDAYLQDESNSEMHSKMSDVDIVTLYRLTMESFNRLALKGFQEEVSSDEILNFVFDTMMKYQVEVDVVTLGMKFISDIVKILTRRTKEIIHLIMNLIQFYAPPAPATRPRIIKRLLPTAEELAQMKAAEEERLRKEQQDQEAQDLLELNQRIVLRQKEAEAKNKEAFLPKINMKALRRQGGRGKSAAKRATIRSGDKKYRKSASMPDHFSGDRKGGLSRSKTIGMRGDDDEVFDYESESNRSRPSSRAGSSRRSRRPISSSKSRVAENTRPLSSSRPKSSTRSLRESDREREQFTPTQVVQPLPTLKSFNASLSKRNLERAADVLAAAAAKKKGVKKSTWDGVFSGNAGEVEFTGTYVPLPQVSGVKFRAFKGSDKNFIGLSQCLMTLFQFVNTHYANREAAMELFVHEELCQIGLDCLGLPKAMKYIIWTVDKLLKDKFDEGGSHRKKTKKVNENMIIFFSIVTASHEDVNETHKTIAENWLQIWSDGSAEFKQLQKKGREMAGMS